MSSRPVIPGEAIRYSAEEENRRRESLEKATHPGLIPGTVSHGQSGILLHPPPTTKIGLFEIVNEFDIPSSSSSSGVGPDVPWTIEALAVWLNHNIDNHDTVDDPTYTLYHPTCLLDGDWPVDVQPVDPGQRVFAWFNPQSGRWEILNQGAHPSVWVGHLDGDELIAGGGNVEIPWVQDEQAGDDIDHNAGDPEIILCRIPGYYEFECDLMWNAPDDNIATFGVEFSLDGNVIFGQEIHEAIAGDADNLTSSSWGRIFRTTAANAELVVVVRNFSLNRLNLAGGGTDPNLLSYVSVKRIR